MPRYACSVDANHKEIVDALRGEGASVIDTSRLGSGFPDLIVGHAGKTVLIEVKNPNTQYGRAGLNKNQLRWKEAWCGGPFSIVTDVESALRVLRVMEAT